MPRILIVDDEQDFAGILREHLEEEGYEVLTAYNGEEALAVARRHRPDLITLDILMPGMSGLEVCRRLRQDPMLAAVPIVFVSVRSAVRDHVKGLDEGADDYVDKPFRVEELKARVRALLRRSRSTLERDAQLKDGHLLVVGSLTLDLQTRQVHVGEKTVQLTPTEFELLRYLMTHAGEVLSSQELLQQVWNYTWETDDTHLVRWHMKNLRAKIEPDPAHPMYIRTLPHHGYMLAEDA